MMDDTSNVTPMGVRPAHAKPAAAPCPEVIAGLEEALDRAKAGHLTGFTLVGVDAERGAFHAHGGFIGTFEMIGAIEAAKQVLLSSDAGG